MRSKNRKSEEEESPKESWFSGRTLRKALQTRMLGEGGGGGLGQRFAGG